jgi:large subunit ribosomal protein L4e
MSAAARPVVSVFDVNDASNTIKSLKLPAVFTAPIRLDVVQFVHTQMNKNKRQAYAVNIMAGHQTSAKSWGTGRAVSRIPRVAGGGTHRSGQAAFGNMCRGGRMFGPTKTWRKWHKKINQNQRRYAVTSALAASAVSALVMSRGHRISNVPEIPLVISNEIANVDKTKKAIATLAQFGADEDVQKAKDSRNIRRGKGKMRNRRYTMRRGPLIVYSDETKNVCNAFKNLSGVELVNVSRLNLLQLAPGGHVGRFCIWTQSAFEMLDSIFGSNTVSSKVKSGFKMPRHMVVAGDIARVINSDAIQSAVRPAKVNVRYSRMKKNPLKNLGIMVKLNPYALTMRRAELIAQSKRTDIESVGKKRKAKKVKSAAAIKALKKARKAKSKAFHAAMMEDEEDSSSEEESDEEEEEV